MAVSGFSHYNLRAPRALLESLREFYCAVVGLEVGERPPFNSFGYWLYAGGHPVLHLSESTAGEAAVAPGRGSFDHAAFECRGRAAFEARLREQHIPFRSAHVPLTGQVQLFLEDPAGNGVELNFDGSES